MTTCLLCAPDEPCALHVNREEPMHEMRALPLHQPWATLVATGEKTIETRDYPPKRLSMAVGDRIAIHANKAVDAVHLGRQEPFRSSLMKHGYWPTQAVTVDTKAAIARAHGHTGRPAPLGALVAVATIEWALEATAGLVDAIYRDNVNDIAFGNFDHGRWAWKLSDVVKLDGPIPVRGHQGSFKVPEDALARILEAVN